MSIRVLTDGSASDEQLLRCLAARGLPDNVRVIYRGRNIVAATADERLCIKAFGVPGFIKGIIYGFFRTPKAVRAYRNALKLRELGINTPAPRGAVTVSECGILRQSYYVCDMLHGWHDLRGVEGRPDFDSIARALAAFMLRLHRLGVLMKDFTQGNVLFRESGGGYEFALVDINRMKFGVSDRRILLGNFGAALDTEAGIRAVAEAYVAQAEPGEGVDGTEELIDIYRRRQAVLWRRRHIKERIRGKRP